MTPNDTPTDNPENTPVARLDSLQVLRGLAAVGVLVYHLGDSLMNDFQFADRNPFAIGANGVDLFFVLSGFVICYASVNTHSPVEFMKKRFFRVAPLYYLLTIGVFAVAFVKPSLLNSTVADWSHLAKSLAFVPFEKSNGEAYPLLFLGWTLNFEMFFYVLFAICLAFKGHRELATATLVIACVIVGQFADFDHVVPEFFSRSVMLNFVWGIGVFLLSRRRPDIVEKARWLWLPATLFILLQAFVTVPVRREFAVGLPSALILLSLLPMQSVSGPVGNSAKLIGDASYSLYLVHPYVIQVCVKLALPILGVSAWSLAAVMIVSVASSVAVAVLLFKLVEGPANSFLRERLL